LKAPNRQQNPAAPQIQAPLAADLHARARRPSQNIFVSYSLPLLNKAPHRLEDITSEKRRLSAGITLQGQRFCYITFLILSVNQPLQANDPKPAC
jgi:hypothetical protein